MQKSVKIYKFKAKFSPNSGSKGVSHKEQKALYAKD